MNKTVFRFTLDLHEQDSQVFVPVRKGDTAHKLSVMLTESGKPHQIASGASAVLAATLPNGSNIYQSCTVNENRIECDLPATFTAAEGRLACCFTVDKSTTGLCTPAFTISVEAPAAPKQS